MDVFHTFRTGDGELEEIIPTGHFYLERVEGAAAPFEGNPFGNCQEVVDRDGACVAIVCLSEISNPPERFFEQGLVPFLLFGGEYAYIA